MHLTEQHPKFTLVNSPNLHLPRTEQFMNLTETIHQTHPEHVKVSPVLNNISTRSEKKKTYQKETHYSGTAAEAPDLSALMPQTAEAEEAATKAETH